MPVLYELFIRHAAYFLDHLGQHDVAQVRVDVAAARLVAQSGPGGVAHHVVEADRRTDAQLPGDAHRAEQRIAGTDRVAALMPEQVLDGDLFDPAVADFSESRVAENALFAEHPVFERQQTVLLQFHDACRRDQLRQRGDAENVLDVGAHVPFLVGPAVALTVQQSSVFHHGDRRAGDLPSLHEPFDDPVESFHLFQFGLRVIEQMVDSFGQDDRQRIVQVGPFSVASAAGERRGGQNQGQQREQLFHAGIIFFSRF